MAYQQQQHQKPLANVLISDAVDQRCVDLLRAHGIGVTCQYGLTKEQLIAEIPKYDGLIVRSDTKVTSAVLEAGRGLRVVGRAGTGVDNIDVAAATRRGVVVLNTPGGNSISACELTCSLITVLARSVVQGCVSLKENRWDRKKFTGSELSGKTLAVLGLGRIGREVALRMQAFGMKTIGYDPIVSAEDAAAFNIEKKELEEIWPLADYITVHTPLIPQTKNLINGEVLSKCKRGVRIVNVARGGIVDEAALLEALKDERCGGAALDVFVEEPPKSAASRSLVEHPAVVCTPHLGASTKEAQTRVAVEIAEQFVALSDPNSPYKITGAVNAPALGASCDPQNGQWIALATGLGRLAGRALLRAGVATLADARVELVRTGSALERMGAFLGTAAASGLLAGHGHAAASNGLNLVNAPQLAHEAGLAVAQRYQPPATAKAKAVTLTVAAPTGSFSVTGTIKSKSIQYLVSVNGADFGEGGVAVADWRSLLLFKGSKPRQDFVDIAGALSAKGAEIVKYSSATSPGTSDNFYLVGLASPFTDKLNTPNLQVIF